MTKGGAQGKRVGMADEPLTDREKKRLTQRAAGGDYPEATLAYTSGLYRCRETATLIYPRSPAIIMDNLRPLDAGGFEGKTHAQLLEDPRFSPWAEAEALEPCPDGEDFRRFHVRCVQAFRAIVDEMCSKGIECTAIITHNLVIGAILKRFCLPRSAYRNWGVQWGGGYVLEYDSRYSSAIIHSIF